MQVDLRDISHDRLPLRPPIYVTHRPLSVPATRAPKAEKCAKGKSSFRTSAPFTKRHKSGSKTEATNILQEENSSEVNDTIQDAGPSASNAVVDSKPEKNTLERFMVDPSLFTSLKNPALERDLKDMLDVLDVGLSRLSCRKLRVTENKVRQPSKVS